MGKRAEVETASIVLLGSFNPTIFQPAWFARHDLIVSDEEKVPKGIKLNICHPEVTDFASDDFSLQVIQQRLVFQALNASFFAALKDLAIGTFRILKHTPIVKMGLNYECHFCMTDEEEWHKVGHRLAPKESWQKVLTNPGMTSVSMEGKRTDGMKGAIHVRIEPSKIITPYGIRVFVNDHFEVVDPETNQGCGEMMEILDKYWQQSLANSEKIARAVIFYS
jgi:hypothetical protein